MRNLLTSLFATLLLAGCMSDRIDTAVTNCCAQRDYKTFTVKADDIPAFLGPLMVSNFSVAFANRGVDPVMDHGDLNVVLRFEQIDVNSNKPIGDLDESTGVGAATRFIARIDVLMYDTKTSKLVWGGHIQRIHDVAPGDYMHAGPASIAIYKAFTRLLSHYPGKRPAGPS